MRRFGLWLLILAAAAVTYPAVAAAEGNPSDPTPSLEYRPPRVVVPEPKAPTPAPPITIFREAVGSFGIGTGSFSGPIDVAADGGGNFFVLDAGNSRVQKFDNFSNFKYAWGAYGSRSGEFKNPRAIVVDESRADFLYVFVLDAGNNRVQIFQFEKQSGKCVNLDSAGKCGNFDSWGGLGSRDGDFKDPRDLVIDGEGAIWVLDSGNERVQKFKFDPDKGVGMRITFLASWGKLFGSRGGKFDDLVSIGWSRYRFGYLFLLGPGCLVQQFQLDGTLVNSWPAIAPESGLCAPGRIEIDNRNDFVYVLDSANGLFERFNLEGRFLAALRGAERPFSKPRGLAVLPERDEVLIADTDNSIVQKFTLR